MSDLELIRTNLGHIIDWAERMNIILLGVRAIGDLAAQSLAALPEPSVPPSMFRISPPITDIPLRITDPFNAPRTYANKKHEGTDFDAYDEIHRKLVNVCAVAAGTILLAVKTFQPLPALGYGIHIIIDHGNGYRSWYCHLSILSVTVGQAVKRGEVIGVSGRSGTAAIHLHLNLQHIGHGLSGYFIPDAIDPMSIMETAQR